MRTWFTKSAGSFEATVRIQALQLPRSYSIHRPSFGTAGALARNPTQGACFRKPFVLLQRAGEGARGPSVHVELD
jgi:hypothetical protein